MSTEAKDVVDQSSPLGLSDEDFLKSGPPVLTASSEELEQPDEDKDPVEVEKPEGEEEEKEDKTDAKDDADEPGDSPDEEKAADAEEDKEEKEVKEPKASDSEEEKDKTKPEAKDDKSKEPPAVDFEAEYKRLLAPFKANGRDIQVNSVDDAISLMQMGANYNKKMAALKPNLKLMKMLENNGFLSEDKIGFLIDLGKKNPAAINKLVKDSGLDPMDLDAEKANAYKATSYTVDDREIELDTVLDELNGSPAYNRTLDVVSNKWDLASKQVISQSPQLLKVIADHVASGIYDRISTEVERGRMLGRLNGLSDIEAYRQVGDEINARGGFNDLVQPKPNQSQSKPAAAVVVPPKPKVEDDKLKDKRRAASSTKPAAPSSTPADFNPLALSDEEFSRAAAPKFQ